MHSSRLQLYFYEDIIALNLDRIGIYRLDGWHREGLASAHIKARPVAWARNMLTHKPPACQRSPIVRTHILNSVVLSIDIKEGHR
jgi:hypothetical protein